MLTESQAVFAVSRISSRMEYHLHTKSGTPQASYVLNEENFNNVLDRLADQHYRDQHYRTAKKNGGEEPFPVLHFPGYISFKPGDPPRKELVFLAADNIAALTQTEK